MNRKIVNVVWFGNIGIISTIDNITEKRKSYIGTGAGISEDDDIDYILNHGTRFYDYTARFLNNHLN